MAAPLLITIFHYLMCGVGVTINTFLLAIIIFRTPENLKGYAVLLFSQTLPQATTCFTSGILFTRVIPNDMSAFLVITGPVNIFGSEQIAYYIWCMMVHGHAHYSIMLAVCFCYRYYVILNPTPKFLTIVLLVVLTYLPTPIIYADIYNETTARNILSVRGASYIFDERDTVTGLINVLEPSVIGGIGWSCAPCFPAYTVMLWVGRAMSRTLSKNVQHMSDATRASHREIMRGLVLQACLPGLYCFAVVTYAVGQLDLLHLTALEYATHMRNMRFDEPVSNALLCATVPKDGSSCG